jgi:hypothetical protein
MHKLVVASQIGIGQSFARKLAHRSPLPVRKSNDLVHIRNNFNTSENLFSSAQQQGTNSQDYPYVHIVNRSSRTATPFKMLQQVKGLHATSLFALFIGCQEYDMQHLAVEFRQTSFG